MSGRSAETTSAWTRRCSAHPSWYGTKSGASPALMISSIVFLRLWRFMDRVQHYLHAPVEHATRTASYAGVMAEHRAGRPRASSRETLAEAACELFLEQGFEATTIADITSSRGRQPLELLQLLRVEVRHPVVGPGRARSETSSPISTARRGRMRLPGSAPLRCRCPRTSRPTASRSHSSTPPPWGSPKSSSARRRSDGLASRGRSPAA